MFETRSWRVLLGALGSSLTFLRIKHQFQIFNCPQPLTVWPLAGIIIWHPLSHHYRPSQLLELNMIPVPALLLKWFMPLSDPSLWPHNEGLIFIEFYVRALFGLLIWSKGSYENIQKISSIRALRKVSQSFHWKGYFLLWFRSTESKLISLLFLWQLINPTIHMPV